MKRRQSAFATSSLAFSVLASAASTFAQPAASLAAPAGSTSQPPSLAPNSRSTATNAPASTFPSSRDFPLSGTITHFQPAATAEVPAAAAFSDPGVPSFPTFMPGSAAAPTPPPSRFAAPPSPYTPATPEQAFLTFSPAQQEIGRNPLLQWGPFRVIPAASYRFSYSTGLPGGGFGGVNRDQPVVQHSISPSITLASTHLTLNYTPSLTYYTKGPYGDSLNHSASLRVGFGYGDWRFGISQSYAAGSQVLAETARQTETESHSTALSASWRITDRTSLDLTASQSINNSDRAASSLALNNSKTWSSMNWLNYQVTDITRLGIGLGGGYSAVDLGSDMTFEQVQGRISWAPRPKISLDLNGGIEIRQFLGQSGASDRLNPIMGATGTYRPFDQTTLLISANRGVSASLFANQITETTSFSAALSQRFLEHFNASLSGGLRVVDYQSSARGFQADRSDNVTFISASLGTQLFGKLSAAVSYSHTSNNSNEALFTYDVDTIAATLGYSF